MSTQDSERSPAIGTRRWPGRRSVILAVILGVVVFGGGLFAGRATVPPAAAAPSPGAVDIGFCQDMAVHHAQAVLMAQAALSHATTPDILLIAKEILTTQAQERGTMAGWLTLWQAPQLPSGPPMTWMSSMHSMPTTATTMPGMASQADLDRLARASGRQFDILFLQLMIRHHDGGIVMATDAHEHASLSDVRALAGAMVLDQNQENAIMGALLTADGAKALPLN